MPDDDSPDPRYRDQAMRPDSGLSLSFASKQCPRCGSSHVRRSAFQSEDEAQLHHFTSPYRCEACGQRFLVLSRKTRRAMIWIIVLVIMAVTIAWLIPLVGTPQAGKAASGGATVARRSSRSQATEIIAHASFYGLDFPRSRSMRCEG